MKRTTSITWRVPAFILIAGVILSGCSLVPTPVSSVPTATQPSTLVMVRAADLPKTLIGPATLLVVQLGDAQPAAVPNVVLGPRSAFSEPPASALALIDDKQVPEGTTRLATVSLSYGWDLSPQQVIILASPDQATLPGGPATRTPGLSLEADVYATLPGGSLTAKPVDIGKLPASLELRLKPQPGGPIAQCVDWIQCFCLWCGCCQRF